MARIAIVSTSHWPAAGGSQVYQRLLSRELSRRHEVTVLAQCDYNVLDSYAELTYGQRCFEQYEDGRVVVRCVGPGPHERLRLLPFLLFRSPRGARIKRCLWPFFTVTYFTSVYRHKLLEILRRFDLIHTFKTVYLGGACMQVAREIGIPCVCTPHIHIGRWLDDPPTMRQLRHCDHVFSALEYDRAYMIAHMVPADRIEAVGVPFDPSAQGDPGAFRRCFDLETHPLICFVGAKRDTKGYDKLLEAAPLVWQVFPEARFVFIGLRSERSSQVFSGVRDPRILEFGHVDAQEKTNALAACDVFCLPSVSESFGIVFLEAWHLGKPVIAANVPPSKELVGACGGGLTVPQTAEAIAKAITYLLDHPDERERMGKSGRATAQRYTIEEIGRRVQRVYGTLLGEES